MLCFFLNNFVASMLDIFVCVCVCVRVCVCLEPPIPTAIWVKGSTKSLNNGLRSDMYRGIHVYEVSGVLGGLSI